MKYLFCIVAALLFSSRTVAQTAETRWKAWTGRWDVAPGRIAPLPDGSGLPCLLADLTGAPDDEWHALRVRFTLSAPAGNVFFGLLLNAQSGDDYQLLRVSPESGGTTLQMLHWKYGYFRQWQEVRFPALAVGKPYELSIGKAPYLDREDWRPWKVVVRDAADGAVLLKTGIENEMPAFGLGTTGLYATAGTVVFSDYALDRPASGCGGLRLPAVFSDGMVLQRGQKNQVWGKAPAGNRVSVSLAGRKYAARADAGGRWRVTLAAMSADSGLVMRVASGRDTVVLRDIAVGEVWLASGQSNMEMKVWESDVPVTPDAGVRLFAQPQWPSEEPLFTSGGRWQRSDSDAVPRWSAVAYAFARELRMRLGVPVGILGAYYGGTAIESWLPREELAGDSLTRPILDRYEQSLYRLEHGLPLETRFPQSWDVAGQRHTPGNLFNGMVHPLIPYGIAGTIWYQGESNASKVRQYGSLFPMLIEAWRGRWGDPALPFYYVQLAGYDGGASGAEIESAWPYLRDVQRRALDRCGHTGMAVAFDLGDSLNIHPPHKQAVGMRLAGLALHDRYGFRDIVRSGPLPHRVSFSRGRAVVGFRETAAGLRSSDGRPLAGFEVAGSDRVFRPAVAAVGADGVTVTVFSPEVPDPAAVRYGWVNYSSAANLVNSAGLPASPFRTDDWPLPAGGGL